MDTRRDEPGTSTFCSLHFFDCLSSRKREDGGKRFSLHPAVKKETNVLYQQPHLVEPMKLRVYEDLPATPVLPTTPHLAQWGRNLAQRASSRTSRSSMKRPTTSKSMISKPQLITENNSQLPLRRGREFNPIQLSIYAESSRLSDLPEFDRFSFTELGELKLPPKALIRTQSESVLRKPSTLIIPASIKTNSMVEISEITSTRPGTSGSIISMSRPPSEYDALHSHPVLPVVLNSNLVAKSQKVDNMVAVMTPMQEEFSPIPTVAVGETVLSFPKSAKGSLTTTAASQSPPTPGSQAPYPTVSQGPTGAAKNRSKPARPSYHTATQSQTQKRISQWLQYRNNSASTSSIGSVSTTASFAEHRRKRSEFYKLGQQTQVPAPSASAPALNTMVPQPLNFNFSKSTITEVKTTPEQQPEQNLSQSHVRTETDSSFKTTNTSILSSTFDNCSSSGSEAHNSDGSRTSEESMTSCVMPHKATHHLKLGTGTIKSVNSPAGLKIVSPKYHNIAVHPALKGEIDFVLSDDEDDSPGPAVASEDADEVYINEIHGMLRSPVVGLAF